MITQDQYVVVRNLWKNVEKLLKTFNSELLCGILADMQLTLTDLSEKYQVNKNKPYFPLNSLRLVYLIFAETVTASDFNVVQRRSETILSMIPVVQKILDSRTAHRTENSEATLETEWDAIQPHLEELFSMIDTPELRSGLQHIFSYVFPLQDTLLVSLYSDLANSKKFQVQDIYTVFHIRSMDSIVYSSIVGSVLQRDLRLEELPASLQMSLNYKLNALYQLNDLVDAIVYAKEDMEGKNFSPFELIRNASGDVTEAKEIIKSIASTFERRIHSFALGEDTERLLTDFSHQLVGVISQGTRSTP